MKIFLIAAWSIVCVSAAAIALLEVPAAASTDAGPGHEGRTRFVRQMADAKTCRLRHGEASFSRNFDGRLVCIPRRGPAILEKDED